MSFICSVIHIGADGFLVDVECHVSNSLPAIVIVGLGGKSINESKERVRAAFASSNIRLPRKRITINLAPADLPKDSSSLDLAIATAILTKDPQIKVRPSRCEVYIGELGLDGTLRPVRGVIGKVLAAKRLGITTIFLPQANLEQARLIQGVKLYPLNSLSEMYSYLSGNLELSCHTGLKLQRVSSLPITDTALGDIAGQAVAKQALQIAAAGGHNLLLYGPPGTGKSMLAKALISLLPALDYAEILEVTQLNSLVSTDYESLVTARPLRAPHHTTSRIAMIGGGSRAIPGEVSLSHGGVLLLDEMPEFDRDVLESLRQPLEDGSVTITRMRRTVTYPARFILVATANPCPCGYYGSTRECSCTATQVAQYMRKLSGPLLDRIDMHVQVNAVSHRTLLSDPATHHTEEIRDRILRARETQNNRLGGERLNAHMSNQEIKKSAQLSPPAKELLNRASETLGLSARTYMKLIRVGRTIADIDGRPVIETGHITEALQYRNAQPTDG